MSAAPFALDELTAALAGLGDDVLRTHLTLGTPSDLPTAEVAGGRWVEALVMLRDQLGLRWFDWLSAVDDVQEVRVVVSLLSPDGGHAGHGVLLSTALDHADPVVDSATPVFPGAAWHEREAHEMFGIGFAGHPDLRPLLLPHGFDGHPLRKDFVLASRVARQWPGEHEPSGRTRRRALPPGVPEPGTWGDA